MQAMAVEGKNGTDADAVTRASVSFPRALYLEIARIAKNKKVSVAWVVREAAEQYVASQWPLLSAASNARPQHG